MIASDTMKELKEISKKIEEIKRKLEEIEEIILPSEKITGEEKEEIERLREESLRGEYISWDELKKEILDEDV